MSDSFDTAKLIGMKLGDAQAYAKSFNPRWIIRPVRINGEALCVCEDYNLFRTNVALRLVTS